MNHEEADRGHVALDGVAPIVTELSRAMPAALLYPAEHQRFAELADPVLSWIRGLAGDGGSFVLEVDGGGMWAMGSELPEDAAGVIEMREVLMALGVSRLEVDASARRRDLHALLGRLGQGKRRLEVVGEVRDLCFDDLPATVRARRREMGKRVQVGDKDAGPGLKLSLGSAARGGAESAAAAPTSTGGAQVLRLGDLGEAPRPRIMRREHIPDPPEAGGPAGESQEGPKLILHGKANQEALAERAQDERAQSEKGGRRATDQVGAEDAPKGRRATDNEDRRDLYAALAEGVSMLDALLGTEPPSEGVDDAEQLERQPALEPEVELEDAPRVSVPAPVAERRAGPVEHLSLERDGCELSIEELRERIDANAMRVEPFTHSHAKDRCEELSILLQLLTNTSDPAAQRGLGAGLDRLLSDGVAGQEREVVHGSLHELVATRDVAQVDATLPLVLAPLRRSRVESIGALLLELLRDGPAEAVGLLWPHVANEVLLGVKHEEEPVARAMFELVGRIPEELLRAGLGRLAALEALRSGGVSEDLLREPAREVARLLAELLESGESEEIGLVLLTSFKSRPPVRAAEIALSGFNTCVPSCRRLLVALLRDLGRGRQTRAANDVAGRILVESLERLAPHKREDTSVLEAIGALGGMRHRPARSILNQILRERKAMLLPSWPTACREAAQRALKTLGVD